MARLALALYLNLGVRKCDVVRIGGRAISGMASCIISCRRRPSRTGRKRITITLFAETKAADRGNAGHRHRDLFGHLFGKPFTANGFGNRMRQWCDEAGLPDCTCHGLRKLLMVRLVHEGYSAPAIGAISGHKTCAKSRYYRHGPLEDGH